MPQKQKEDVFWFWWFFFIIQASGIPQNFGYWFQWRLTFAFYFSPWLNIKKFLTQNAVNIFSFSPCQQFYSYVFLFQKMNTQNVFICLFDKYAWMLNNLSLKLTCQTNHDTNIMMKHYSALKMNFCNSHNWPLGRYWLMKQYFNRNWANLCAGLHRKIYIFYDVQIHLANHQQYDEGCRFWFVFGPESCVKIMYILT